MADDGDVTSSRVSQPDAPTFAAGEEGRVRLNPIDAALWDIERDPALRTTIVAVLLLDRPIGRDRLLADLGTATHVIPRLRQRVVGRPLRIGPPYWETDRHFELEQHVAFVDAPAGVDDELIAAVVEPLASSPMDRRRPLWECTYVGGPAGPAALVVRAHHTMTDGLGGIALLDSVLERDRGGAPREPAAGGAWTPPGRPTEAAGDGGRRLRSVVELPARAASLAGSALTHPVESVDRTRSVARSTARLLAPSSAPLSPLMRERSAGRRVGMISTDLDRLHRAVQAQGCTVNHAFFAGVLGGVADYHKAHGRPVDNLRVSMPVSVRGADDPAAGNQWAPVRFVVPTCIEDPLDRMLVMRDLAGSARREPALPISQWVAGLVQRLPPALSSALVGGMMRGVDLTLTNVPGLSEPHYLCGAEIERIFAFAPTAGAALNAALVSNVDEACLGLLCDAAAVTDPDELRGLVEQHLEEVVRVAERRSSGGRPAREQATVATRPPERLSALDTGFLRLETADTPMHIGGVMILDGRPLRDADGRIRLGELQQHISARLRHLPRFTRRVAEVPFSVGRPVWVDDDHFDITRHVRIAAIPSPGGRAELLDLCAQLFEAPLDRGAPLWELWIVDGLADGSVGIVEKVHHALIDGVSGVELAAVLFDAEPDVLPERPAWRATAPGPGPLRRVTDAVVEQLGDPLRTTWRAGRTLAHNPGHLGDRWTATVSALGEVVRATSTPALPFNRPVGRRRVLYDTVLDLERVDRVRRALDATVNDVVLSCVAGALRRWFEGDPRMPSEVNVLVPVSTRRGGMASEPGNRVGGAIVALPIAEIDPRQRLTTISDRTRRSKAGRAGEAAAVLLGALDHLPATADQPLADLLKRRTLVNLVVTNVRGSRQPLYFLGAQMLEAIPVVPLGPRLGLGVAVLSYTDRLAVSLFADPTVCPDVRGLADAIADEFAILAGAACR
jgi:WS/DGAT/MGAT family acyltransferase